MRARGLVAAAMAAGSTLVACGEEAALTTSGPAPDRPTGADQVVVQVMVAGGFLPVEAAVTAVPTVTVLGDGTVITGAPVPAIYPGPAMPPLQAATADSRTVDGLLRRGRELGLLAGPLDFGRPPVADAPDTTVTIVAGGRTHVHTANALVVGDVRGGGGETGLSPAQAANREALKEFVAATEQLPPGDRQWRPAAIAVYMLGDYRPEPMLRQPDIDWPLARQPATTGGSYPCTLFQGDEAGALLDVLPRANARTPWVVDGARRSLAFRPILPGQPACER